MSDVRENQAAGRAEPSADLALLDNESLRREVERLRVLASGDAPGLLEVVLNHSPHGIIVCDAEGKLTLHNKAAERIWAGSSTAESIADWSKYRAFHPDGRPYGPEDWSMIRCLRSRDVVPAEEVLIQRFDGTRAVLVGSCAPIAGPAGELRGPLSVFGDVTESHRLAAAERTTRERLAKLQAVTAALSEAQLPSDVARVVATEMAAVLGADQAVLATTTADHKELLVLGTSGPPASAARTFARSPSATSLPLGEAFRTGKPIWISSPAEYLERYPHPAGAAEPAEPNAEAIACAPLVVRGVTFGAIGFGFGEKRSFDAADRSLIEDLARQAALALQRAHLLESEQRARQRLEILARSSRQFLQPAREGGLLDSIVTEVGTALRSAVVITLADEEGRPRVGASYHPVPEARELVRMLHEAASLRTGDGPAGRAPPAGESVLIPALEPQELAARAAGGSRAVIARYPMYAFMCVPLRVQGAVIGTLAASRTEKGDTYTPDDLLLLEEIGERAALAIENSRLHEDNRRARFRAEQLYAFAQTLVTAERIDDTLEAALDAIERGLETRRAAILAFDDAGVMRFRAWRRLSDEYRRAVEGHSPWGPATVSPEPVLVGDVEADPSVAGFLPLFAAEGIRSLAFIPIVAAGRLLGKFMVYHDRPHRYSTHEVGLAVTIANHLGSMMERFTAAQERQKNERLFRSVFENAADGILVTRLDGTIVAANSSACTMLGFAPAELVNANAVALIDPADLQKATPQADQLAAGRIVKGERRMRRRDGTVIVVDGTGAKIDDNTSLSIIRDITERKKMVEALRESESRFRTMADDTPLIIWVTDARGEIQFVNRAYCEFFGTTLEAVQQRGSRPVVHPDDAAAYDAAFAEAHQEQKAFRARTRLLRADGQWRWVDSYGQPRFSASGEFLGIAGSSPDVTEAKAAEDQLRDALAYAELFIGVLSHDLRNPLGAILTAADLGLRRSKDEVIQRAFERVSRSGSRMQRMIEQLLDITRIRAAGGLQLLRSSTDLATVCRMVVSEWEETNPQAKIAFEAVGKTTGIWDADRLSQLVSNLVGNAVQHGAGSREIRLMLDGTRPNEVILRVHNWGAIRDSVLPVLFDPFRKAAARGHRPAGLGLGLYITQQIARAHGAEVRVESTVEGGTTFSAALPRDAVDGEAREQEVPAARLSAADLPAAGGGTEPLPGSAQPTGRTSIAFFRPGSEDGGGSGDTK